MIERAARAAAVIAAMLVFQGVALADMGEPGGGTGAYLEPVKPDKDGNCPGTHPIKGNFRTWKRTKSFYLPGDRYYGVIRAEICFPSEEVARNHGYIRPRD